MELMVEYYRMLSGDTISLSGISLRLGEPLCSLVFGSDCLRSRMWSFRVVRCNATQIPADSSQTEPGVWLNHSCAVQNRQIIFSSRE